MPVLFALVAPLVQEPRITLDGATALPVALLEQTIRQAIVGADRAVGAARAAAAVQALYRDRGFSLAQVITAEWSDQALHLVIAEGRIRTILIRGNRRTRATLIRAALTSQEGDVYREDRIAADRQRLGRLGIFADVRIAARGPGATEEALLPVPLPPKPGDPAPPVVEPLPPPPGDDELGVVDLVVRVQETQTGNVAATVGYSDQSGLVGFVDLTEDNLFGTAQRVSLQWQRTANVFALGDGSVIAENPRQSFNLTLARPALGTHNLGVTVSAYDQNTVFLPFFGGTTETLRTYERRRGGRVQISRNLSAMLSAFVTARRDDVGYDPVPDRLNPPLEELAVASARVGALGLGAQIDGRDRIDSPRRGFLHRITLENASSILGGTRSFQQAQLDLRQYLPMNRHPNPAVFAARLLGATSQGSTPLSEQFYLGGFELLRGYDLYAIRGDRMVLGSAEVRLPIGQGLMGVIFGDFGNAYVPGTPVALGSLKAGVGVGLRFASPIGPIRFDAAVGDRLRTYISLGQSF
jgi:outer membrane protein assembly factor BamA